MKPQFVREAAVETIEIDGKQQVVVLRDALCDVCEVHGPAECDLHRRQPASPARGLTEVISGSWARPEKEDL